MNKEKVYGYLCAYCVGRNKAAAEAAREKTIRADNTFLAHER